MTIISRLHVLSGRSKSRLVRACADASHKPLAVEDDPTIVTYLLHAMNEEGEPKTKRLKIHVASQPEQYYYIKNGSFVLSLSGDINRPDQLLAGTAIVIKEKVRDKLAAGSQMWYLEDAGDGYCYIVSMLNRFVLDIKGAQWNMSTPVILWPKNSPPTVIANQKWKIDVEEGVIVSQLNGQVLQVQQNEKSGSPVIMMKKIGVAEDAVSQRWEFEPIIDQ